MTNKLIISGFGGQGVLSLGKFISYSSMHENMNTSWLPSYGPEMRGGTANCSVIYSNEEIAAPVIDKPDMLLAFNEPSLAKFVDRVKSGGIIITNSDIVKMKVQRKDIKVYEVPLDSIAAKINPKGGNIIALGMLLAITGHISRDSAIKAIEEVFSEKPKLVPINIQCLDEGMKYINSVK